MGDPISGPSGVIGHPDQPDTHDVLLLSILADFITGLVVLSGV
jgi:hypothetical protein